MSLVTFPNSSKDPGVTDRENAEQLQAIRESLNALEGGRVIEI